MGSSVFSCSMRTLSCRMWDLVPWWWCCLVTQSRLTLCNPVGCIAHQASVHGILQAWILERVDQGSNPGSLHWGRGVLSTGSPGKSQSVRSVAQACPTLWPHESQHARPPCPSPTPGVHSNSRPSSQWCHPAISSSVVLFSSCPQSLPASESFPMSQLFARGDQSTGVSALASFLPKKSQGWPPLEWTGWISLQSKGLSRVFSNTIVHFFTVQLSHHTWPLEKP